MNYLRIIFLLTMISILLFQCTDSMSNPNAFQIEQIENELKNIKNKNIVFGVNKIGAEKIAINLESVGEKMEALEILNSETEQAYLAFKNSIRNENDASKIEFNKNKLALNDYLYGKSKALMTSLLKEKVYEGSELKNAYWLISNQIEQMQFLKKAIILLSQLE